MKGIVAAIILSLSVFWMGFLMKDSQRAFSQPEMRQVILVDAWDEYTESGRHVFKGVFVDKKENTRFHWSIEPQTFRDFDRTGQQRDMQVFASHFQVNGHGGSPSTDFFGAFFMVAAILTFLGTLFVCLALLFDW